MSQSILIFNFGTNEEAAQQARHKIEGWKQTFHLGNKVQLKFERAGGESESEDSAAGEGDGANPAEEASEKKSSGARKRGAKKQQASKAESAEEKKDADTGGNIRILIRLDFSDHEKLSHQRWLERISAEEPFKSAEAETLRQADDAFDKTSELFDSLD